MCCVVVVSFCVLNLMYGLYVFVLCVVVLYLYCVLYLYVLYLYVLFVYGLRFCLFVNVCFVVVMLDMDGVLVYIDDV